MAGHSKWSKIKRKKGAEDAKRSQAFSKIIREIQAAARQGGPDEGSNPRLRTILEKGRALNMPSDNIKRALQRAEGGDGADFVEAVYEGFGPEGVAVVVESLTDNRNRTIADLRHLFNKNGGSLGDTGCVGWMFSRVGQAGAPFGKDKEATELALMEAGAEEIEETDDGFDITVPMENFEQFKQSCLEKGITLKDPELAYVASNTVTLDERAMEKIMDFVDVIEGNDDVQAVWLNAE